VLCIGPSSSPENILAKKVKEVKTAEKASSRLGFTRFGLLLARAVIVN
jgi:hypothetical protein